jgi:lysophospholipase L1-like esterase
VAEANGATMVHTTMPVLAVARPGIPTVPDGHLKSLASQNRRLRDLAAREGWLLVDLAKLTDELTPTFEDAIHVSIQGEQIKARAIADALVQAGLVSQPANTEATPSE